MMNLEDKYVNIIFNNLDLSSQDGDISICKNIINIVYSYINFSEHKVKSNFKRNINQKLKREAIKFRLCKIVKNIRRRRLLILMLMSMID